MALSQVMDLENGIQLPSAYIKIKDIRYVNAVNEPNYVIITVNIFKDQAARLALKPEVSTLTHKCTTEDFANYFSVDILKGLNVTIVSQGYIWLKTMPLYENAVDVIDEKE